MASSGMAFPGPSAALELASLVFWGLQVTGQCPQTRSWLIIPGRRHGVHTSPGLLPLDPPLQWKLPQWTDLESLLKNKSFCSTPRKGIFGRGDLFIHRVWQLGKEGTRVRLVWIPIPELSLTAVWLEHLDPQQCSGVTGMLPYRNAAMIKWDIIVSF